MSLILRAIGIILMWAPIVLSSVQRIEVLLTNKTGPEKKEAALGLIMEALKIRGVQITPQVTTLVSGMVEFVVSLLNAWDSWKAPKQG
jgi:hypothetical protein